MCARYMPSALRGAGCPCGKLNKTKILCKNKSSCANCCAFNASTGKEQSWHQRQEEFSEFVARLLYMNEFLDSQGYVET